jgi:hypothetical protein
MPNTCKMTYYNYGSYLRSRGVDQTVCVLKKELEDLKKTVEDLQKQVEELKPNK